jgi:YVTN family beta-propeller protein
MSDPDSWFTTLMFHGYARCELKRTLRMFGCLVAGLLLPATPLFAQLDQNCVVSILNRNVQANADGSWILPNVPANFGLVRARASCVRNGVTIFGQSDLFSLGSNQTINLPHIQLGAVTAIPVALTLQVPSSTLTQTGATEQLTVTAAYADNSVKDVTGSAAGTQYTVSNAAIATVSPEGLVTAVGSGTAVIQAVNEGRQGIATIQVVTGASHGGIPDSWAIAHGLDPNDPAMPFEDPDHDGLTNLQEFQNGTDPNNPDTDGDGLTDGQEVLIYHTNPVLLSTDGTGIPDGIEVRTGTLGGSFSAKLAAALQSLEVKPSAFTLDVNTIQGVAAQQLSVLGHLIDGKTTLDLTSTQEGTNYSSSDLTICNFGAPDGNVFSGSNGTCTITVSNNGFSAQATGLVKTFAPTSLSFISIPGFANGVDVNGNFAFVAAGAAGLQVVNITDRTHPFITGSLALPGNANDVKLLGNLAYVAAGSAGVHIIDVSTPSAPVKLGTLSTGANALDIAVRGTRIYVANSTNLLLADVTNPASPSTIATLPLSGAIQGVDVDTQRNLAVVAAGTSGIYTVDISNPKAPKLLGSTTTGDARDVAITGNFAFVADFQRSTTSVDITSPSVPVVLSHILDPNLGGFLQDIVLSGNFALAADVKFVNGIPITDITDPTNLQARAILNFPQRDDNGMGIAADGTYVYLVTEHSNLGKFGSLGDSRLYIGQYLALVDNKGIPPTATITTPAAGSTVVEGSILPITVNATDDVAVAGVSFLVNGQTVFTATSAPYQFDFNVPLGITSLTLGATAVDLGGNTGAAQNVLVNVIPDPGTTVVGRVLDQSKTPFAGATVTATGGNTSTTGADGTFSIRGVPTVRGNISVRAVGTVNGVSRSGTSTSVPPVANGTTDVGDITLGGGFIAVSNSNSNTATIIDPSTTPPTVVATVPTGFFPIGASVTPDGSTALISNFDSGSVTIVNLTTTPPAVRGTPISIGTATESTAITTDGRFAVTADGSLFSVNVSSIDIAGGTILSTLSMPATSVAITPDNGTVIIGDFNNNQFAVLSLSAQGILTDTGVRIPNTGGSGEGPTAVAPDDHFVLASNLFSNSLTVLGINASGVTLGGSIPLCCGPWGVAISPNGTKAYVAMTDSTVAVLNIDANDNVTDTGVRISIPGGTPTTFFGTPGIAFSSDGARAYVSNYSSGTITILDATTNTILSTVPVGSGPAGIGVPR